MKRVILNIDDEYATVLCMTVVGVHIEGANVANGIVDLRDGGYIEFDSNGNMTQRNLYEMTDGTTQF